MVLCRDTNDIIECLKKKQRTIQQEIVSRTSTTSKQINFTDRVELILIRFQADVSVCSPANFAYFVLLLFHKYIIRCVYQYVQKIKAISFCVVISFTVQKRIGNKQNWHTKTTTSSLIFSSFLRPCQRWNRFISKLLTIRLDFLLTGTTVSSMFCTLLRIRHNIVHRILYQKCFFACYTHQVTVHLSIV